MRTVCDFDKDLRGKYAKKYEAGTNIVLLGSDVVKVVKSPRVMNQVLRGPSPGLSRLRNKRHSPCK